MIEALKVTNYQKHKGLVIKFDKAVTTIVGASGVGKSAVIRALLWTITNQPSGIGFVREGTNKATSLLKVDGHLVKRSRGKGCNTYSLDGEGFKAFGNGKVPEPIANLLNIQGTNWQGQHDAPFWFSNTAGEVSRQLNQIVNLGVIDNTLANLDSEKRRTVQTIGIVEERLAKIKKDGKALNYVNKCNKAYGQLANLYSSYQENAQKALYLSELIKRVRQHTHTQENALKQATSGGSVLEKADLYRGLVEKAKNLAVLVGQSKTYKATINSNPPVVLVNELTNHKTAFVGYRDKLDKLSTLITKATQWQKQITTAQQTKAVMQKRLTKEIGKNCPLCGAPQKQNQ